MASNDDPTGIKAAVATIPSDALSARHQRIAAGLALVREQGMSILAASKEVRVPCSTLHRYVHGLSSVGSEDAVKAHEGAMLAASFDLALLAADRVTERLLDPEHEWRDADLIKAHQAGVQGVALKRRWASAAGESDGDEGLSALAKMLRGADVTITQRPAGHDAIDVSPRTEGDEGE